MASILKLVAYNSSGSAVVTVDFLADAAYRVSSWSPQVAERRPGELGGRGPYGDVEEEMEIVISGATALAKLRSLRQLLEQAARLGRGEPVGAVLFHYKPTASSPELRALVLGGGLELPPNFVNAPVVTVIDPVGLRLLRSGLWYGAEASGTDTTAGNPEVAVVSGLAALAASSPIKVEVTGLVGSHSVASDAFLLVSSAATSAVAAKRIYIHAAEGLADGNFTSVADSTNKARGNSVLRFTPSGLGQEWFETATPAIGSSLDTAVRRWGIFVNYRNNSATNSFRVAARLRYSGAGVGHGAMTPELLVPPGTSNPRWAYLGSASMPDQLTHFSLNVYTELTSGTLDIDDVVLMALDYPDSDRVLALGARGGDPISLPSDLTVDHRVLHEGTPAVYILENTVSYWRPYRGDAALYTQPGATAVAVCWLGSGYLSQAYWRITNDAGTVQSPGVRVTRTNAYLTPE